MLTEKPYKQIMINYVAPPAKYNKTGVQGVLLHIHVLLPSNPQASLASWGGRHVCHGAEAFLFPLTLLLELQPWQQSWDGLWEVSWLAGAFSLRADLVALVKSPRIWRVAHLFLAGDPLCSPRHAPEKPGRLVSWCQLNCEPLWISE